MSNMNELQHLILLLEEVRDAYNISVIKGERGMNTYLNPENRMVDEISAIASSLLFNKRGRVEFANKQELQRHGFKVNVLEQNESGWLICGIEIPRKGILIYYNHVLLDEIEKEEDYHV